jgi:hypothetical protein
MAGLVNVALVPLLIAAAACWTPGQTSELARAFDGDLESLAAALDQLEKARDPLEFETMVAQIRQEVASLRGRVETLPAGEPIDWAAWIAFALFGAGGYAAAREGIPAAVRRLGRAPSSSRNRPAIGRESDNDGPGV